MLRKALVFAVMLPPAMALSACADREEVRAERVAQQATADAEDDAVCQGQGGPGSAEYDACRQATAAKRAQKAEIEYQKRRDFDRVLGGLDDL